MLNINSGQFREPGRQVQGVVGRLFEHVTAMGAPVVRAATYRYERSDP